MLEYHDLLSNRFYRMSDEQKRAMLEKIAGILWPVGDIDAEWDSETIEQVAGVFHNNKVSPDTLK